MNSILICLFVLSNILVCIKPEEITYMASYCPNTTSDYAEGSKFQFNLNRLLYRLLYNNASNSIYANPSVGEIDDDKVHGLHLCRGDVAPKDCQNCIDVASERIQRECRLKKQATILYDQCLIRYSSIPNFASMFNVSSYYGILYKSDQSFSSMKQVKRISDALFDNLTPKATNDLKSAKSFDEITLSLSQKLYGMVQCIPDLSPEDCHACLEGARSVIPKSVPRECKVVHESCLLSYQFKNPEEGGTGAPPPPSPTPGDKDQGEITRKIKVICTVTGVIALLAVVLTGSCLYLKKRSIRRTERERRERRRLLPLLDMEGNSLGEF